MYDSLARDDFERAYQRSLWRKLITRLTGKSNQLLPFDEVRRLHAGLPPHVLLVLDATTGQNGLAQARTFGEAVAVTGLFLTKLDGTAKGGIVFPVVRELKLPIYFVGTGESAEDIAEFNADEFVAALFG